MKSKSKSFLIIFIVCFFCCALFVGVGYFYLNESASNQVDNDAPKVPYYSSAPQNAGVLFDIGGSKTLFFLDFENKILSVIFADELQFDDTELYGYSIDYTISSDYSVLAEMVDISGGIDMEISGELLSCTGVQVVDILTTSPDYLSLRREIIEKIIKNLSKNGFQKQDFLYIIENSETNLTVPDCYFWDGYIKDLCSNVRLVN